jgi:hypothetical protein
MLNNKCDICSLTADHSLQPPEDYDHLHTVYACRDHARYMGGWMRDMVHESRCDSMASRHNDHQRDE